VRLAVESRYFPLVACDDGKWTITFRPKHLVPVSEFLETQGRFAHLSPEEIDSIQAHVDERWDLLASLESQGDTKQSIQGKQRGALK
jgi:pyruvate ferredoxin oxidoreductase beta subunit